VLATAVAGSAAATALADERVAFGDPLLQRAVVIQLVDQGRIPRGSDGTTITPADMQTLTALSAPSQGIASLGGLQYATNLQRLDLSGNRVAAITPLANLANLVLLDVKGNDLDVTTGTPAMTTITAVEGRGGHVDYRPQSASLSRLVFSRSASKFGQRITFEAAITPGGAAALGASTLRLYHLDTKIVSKTVKGRTRKIRVTYWRLRRTLPARRGSSGGLSFEVRLAQAGKWRARATYTGSDDYGPCSSNTRVFTVEDPRIEKAIRWALARRGSHAWDHYCLRFVSDAYTHGAGASVARWSCAKHAADVLHAAAHPSANAPRGAYVFYHSYHGSVDLGHVGISLGNGTMINDNGGQGVRVMPIRCGSRYIGWAAPPLSRRITDWG
jgi:hypothetical protein